MRKLALSIAPLLLFALSDVAAAPSVSQLVATTTWNMSGDLSSPEFTPTASGDTLVFYLVTEYITQFTVESGTVSDSQSKTWTLACVASLGGVAPSTASFTASLSAGAKNGTLSAAITNGNYAFLFSDGELHYVSISGSGTTASWGDGLANNVTANVSYWGATSGFAIYYAQNVSNVSEIVSFATMGGYTYVAAVADVTGVNTSGYEGSACNAQASPGTGTNALTSGTVGSYSGNALLVGFSAGGSGVTSETAPSVGTGFTSGGIAWSNSSSYVAGRSEYETVSSATAATFTASSTNSSGNFASGGISFTYSSGACTHSGLTQSGSFAVPTAGSTLVWLPSGTFGTVNCSSTSYWQPSGIFGVN